MNGGMVDGRDFFASEREKEAGRIINAKDEKIMFLEDEISSLKKLLADQHVKVDDLQEMFNREHALRTRKRTFIDWITGYTG